jgi:putative tricarboxylic transport membrane protein
MQSRRRFGPDRWAGASIAALGACVAWASAEYPFGTLGEPGPGMLPLALAVVLAAFGLVLALGDVVRPAERRISFADLPHALVILLVLAAAAGLIERIGYRLTVLAVFVFLAAAVERRNVFAALAIGLGLAFGSFHLINDVLRVPLPVGPWGM